MTCEVWCDQARLVRGEGGTRYLKKCGDVVHPQARFGLRGTSTNPVTDCNPDAGWRAAKRAENQLVLDQAIESGPVEIGHKLPDKRGDIGHIGNAIRLPSGQAVCRRQQICVEFTPLSPDFDRSSVKGVMIDPVILYQTALKKEGQKGLTDETIYQTRMIIDKELKDKVARRGNLVDKPGPGIGRLSIAITGAEVEGDSFKPWNVVPVSAVLFAAQKAAGIDSKTPSLVIEAKMRDSVTGKIWGEGVYVMSGETFRMESSTPEAFQKLAIDWVTVAVRVAAGMKDN